MGERVERVGVIGKTLVVTATVMTMGCAFKISGLGDERRDTADAIVAADVAVDDTGDLGDLAPDIGTPDTGSVTETFALETDVDTASPADTNPLNRIGVVACGPDDTPCEVQINDRCCVFDGGAGKGAHVCFSGHTSCTSDTWCDDHGDCTLVGAADSIHCCGAPLTGAAVCRKECLPTEEEKP